MGENDDEMMVANLKEPVAMNGTMMSVEFVGADDPDERTPGTYITIRLDEVPPPVKAGRVQVAYLPTSE